MTAPKLRGVILAGGTGSRLMPLTRVTNKALLPVGQVPLIYRHFYLMKEAGIDDILVITGPEHAGDLMRVCGSGADEDIRLTYRIQDKANGIAAALGMAEDFVGANPFAVLLGDNLFFPRHEAATQIGAFREAAANGSKYRLFTKKLDDPRRFGVAVYKDGVVVDIVEKPETAISPFAVVGLYCYTPAVFDLVRAIGPSARGEYEISDVNRALVRAGGGEVVELLNEWVDAGTHHALKLANRLAWEKWG